MGIFSKGKKSPSFEAVKKAEGRPRSLVVAISIDPNKGKDDMEVFHDCRELPFADVETGFRTVIENMARLQGRTQDVKDPDPLVGVKFEEPVRSLKIAVITHLRVPTEAFSPANAVKRQVSILREHGHKVTLFAQEGNRLKQVWDEDAVGVLPHFRREKSVVNDAVAAKTAENLTKALEGFDVAITHDMYIDDCATYRSGIMSCGANVGWLHFCRSGLGHDVSFRMDNAHYVYLNRSEAPLFASKLGVPADRVLTVPNEKDPLAFRRISPLTGDIVRAMRLWDKDVVGVYPFCTTRMDAKGVSHAIATFAALKRVGLKPGLILCNSNAKKKERKEEVAGKLRFAASLGLDPDECVFTSELSLGMDDGVPQQTVSELMGLSNLFVFPSRAEVGPNVLLEAMCSGNLLVVNSDLRPAGDYADLSKAIRYRFGSDNGNPIGKSDDSAMDALADEIKSRLAENWGDAQFRRCWRQFRGDAVYSGFLAPALLKAMADKEDEKMG